MIPVRTSQATRNTISRQFGPKPNNHPSVGEPCPACGERFKGGDYTCLIALGPGADTVAQQRAREGAFYTAVSVEVHWTCATGEPAPKGRRTVYPDV